jgi:hypothetical protein
MQYAHWLMVAGAVLVVLGFIGFALHKNDAGTASGGPEVGLMSPSPHWLTDNFGRIFCPWTN